MSYMKPYLKKPKKWAVEIAQQVRVPATKYDDLSSIPGRSIWWEN